MKILVIFFVVFSSINSHSMPIVKYDCEYTCSSKCIELKQNLLEKVAKINSICDGLSNIKCSRTKYGHAPFKGDKQLLSSFRHESDCELAVRNSRNNVICLKTPYGIAAHKIKNYPHQIGNPFPSINICTKAVRNIKYNMICLKTSYGYASHSLSNNRRDGDSFDTLEDCIKKL